MERVALLVESTGERIGCLLNPSNLVIRRQAGLTARGSINGSVTGAELTDDPVLCTGGGVTELRLDLLFDVSLTHASTVPTVDVRDLTRPLWDLAENRHEPDGLGTIPMVRFIWGKAWNVLGVIEAVAERLEQFSTAGAPGRSWLRLQMRRVSEPPIPTEPDGVPLSESDWAGMEEGLSGELPNFHEVLGIPYESSERSESDSSTPEADPGEGERLDQLAARYFGHSSWWRWIAATNRLTDPLASLAGKRLRLPPPPSERPSL